MSRRKPGPADAGGAKRPKRANNLYTRPEKIPLGTVLTDALNVPWKVGPSIGAGGFGEIYCAYCFTHAAPKTVADYPNVVKIVSSWRGRLQTVVVANMLYKLKCPPALVSLSLGTA